MKRFTILFFSLIGLCFLSVSLAQGVNSPTPLPGFDLKLWGSSAGVFALFVVAAVGLVRTHWPRLTLYAIYGVSLLISEAGAAILYYGGWLTDPAYISYSPPLVWILFGAGAFVIASGGYAALAKLLTGKPGAALIAASEAPVRVVVTSGPVQLQPLGTPGTEPLHDLSGAIIGGVLPMPSGLQVPA